MKPTFHDGRSIRIACCSRLSRMARAIAKGGFPLSRNCLPGHWTGCMTGQSHIADLIEFETARVNECGVATDDAVDDLHLTAFSKFRGDAVG